MRQVNFIVKKLGLQGNLIMLLLAGFLLRLVLANFGTLKLDQGTFIAWSNILVSGGFKNFYNGWSDYLPGYLYVLWFLGILKSALPFLGTTLLYKLPAILADLATGFLIFKILRRRPISEKWALIGSALYIFNPAIFANSTLWGQVDSLTAFFSLLAVYFLEENIYLSSLFLAIGSLIKPQAVFLVPIVLLYAVKNKWSIKKFLIYSLIGVIVVVVGFLPFYNSGNFVNFFISRINVSLNQYPYTSVNAFNFWGIFGFWKNDKIAGVTGLIIFLAATICSWLALRKRKVSYYLLSGLIFLFTFTFLTRMHERHLMLALPFLLIASYEIPSLIFSYIGLSLIYVFNLFWAYNWITHNFEDVFSGGILKLFSFSTFGFSIYSIYAAVKNVSLPKIKFGGAKVFKGEVFPKIKFPAKRYAILAVLIFAFAARVFLLWSPQGEYFDEVYHAFTAKQMMIGNTKAWEWWNTPPQGFAYEWTHPPLAKELMIGGMLVFGQNSFGWRIPAALAGVGILFFVYKISKELFDDEWLSIFATAFLALDGILLVMSRIGMNDSYCLVFVLASFYFYVKDRNLLSAIFAGLGLASKWSTLWFFPILLVTHFVLKKRFRLSYLWFLVLVPVIYIATYLPIFTSKQIQNEYVANNRYETKTDKIGIVPLDMFIDTQKQMWWYHTNLKATHPYTSPWWEWPIEARPIYLYTSGYSELGVANIYAMGNPVVFWFGLGSVFVCLYLSIRDRNRKLGLICFSYFAFFVPWALSPRIMFLYHYLPSIPFLGVAGGYVLRKYLKLAAPVFGVGLLLFIYFCPHWIGIKVPTMLDMSYYWFSSWR